jgi:hypothetical protein
MTYAGNPTDDVRAGTPDGVETFRALYNQIAVLGSQRSTELFVDPFVPMLSLEARRRILNEVLNRPPAEHGRG